MQVLSTAPAPLSSHGPIPGAPPTPELHAECLPLFTGTLPTLRLERAACMQVLSTANDPPSPLFTGTLPTPFGAGSNDFPSPHLGMNRERLCRAYGGVRGEPDCL